MSDPRSVLALSAAPESVEAALTSLSKRGVAVRRLGDVYRFVAAFAAEPADLVIVDSEGFRKQELEMLKMLREMRPEAGIVVLIERDQREIGAGALCGGADLYLLKPASTDELLAAVDRAGMRRRLLESGAGGDQRGEMLGKFAVGVTQKINDSLVIIGMPIQFLIHEYANDERLVKELSSIKREVDRLGNFSHQLLAFAQQGAPENRRVDVGRIVADLGRVYSAQCRQRGIEVACDVNGDLPLILADEAQIRKACDSILEQTAAAMSGAGRIEVIGRAKNNGVEITFQDNGPAIPAHQLECIFDPLQGGARGAGRELGLAMAAGIIQSHGGRIEAHSTDAPLTSFIVWLPATR